MPVRNKVRRILLIIGGIALLLFLFGLSRIPAVLEQGRTEDAVAEIQATTLRMSDVSGENLPPVPDPNLVDATVEGIDANTNGIRDDVELAIFERYPDDPVVRSAMLQYAMGLQLELTKVFNEETWVAAVEESGRGLGCVLDTAPSTSLENTEEEIRAALAIGDARIEEVEELVLNSDMRLLRREEVYSFTTGHGSSDKPNDCDIDPETLITETE
jgi:hypothetical protein